MPRSRSVENFPAVVTHAIDRALQCSQVAQMLCDVGCTILKVGPVTGVEALLRIAHGTSVGLGALWPNITHYTLGKIELQAEHQL